MNKASVLEGTIKYLKELQEKESKLVEQTEKKSVQKYSVVSVKKSQLLDTDKFDASASPENSDGYRYNEQSLPDISVRVSDNSILIRIHCLNQNGYIVRILREIEKLHLRVINSRIIPFGKYSLDATVVTQVVNVFFFSLFIYIYVKLIN